MMCGFNIIVGVGFGYLGIFSFVYVHSFCLNFLFSSFSLFFGPRAYLFGFISSLFKSLLLLLLIYFILIFFGLLGLP